MARFRVLIADDDPAMRDVLAALIRSDEALQLVAVAADAEEAGRMAGAEHPDVALLDVKMPGGGPGAARRIRERSPRTRLIGLSAHEDALSVKEMLAEGVESYLVKGTSSEQILQAIHRNMAGGAILSEQVTPHVISELAGRLERERRDAERDRDWTRRINGVLRNDKEFATVFQPIYDLRSGQVVGMEALSRFGGEPAFPPDVWFGEAARLGLGVALEVAAMQKALSHRHLVPRECFISVNAGPETVLSPELRRVLDVADADRVVVEMTEHAPVRDYKELRSVLSHYRARGMKLAVDDAGAGYASLRHILKLAPDLIKLDIAITRGIDAERPQRALAAALVTFATEIGPTITAEGIEETSELETLRELGVALGQGYLLGRPSPLMGLGGPTARHARQVHTA